MGRLKDMVCKAAIFAVCVSLLLCPKGSDAFFRHLCHGTLGVGRIDPIMSPGEASQHAHVAFGSSAFSFDFALDFVPTMTPNCTSCSIVQDKSAYWFPQLYFKHDNGSFENVPNMGGATLYYFTEPPDVGDITHPIPLGFRMISGNSMKRNFTGGNPMNDDPPEGQWGPANTSQVQLSEKAIGFNCLNYETGPTEGALAYHGMRNKTFIDATCLDGVRAELMFPSCWNGRDLDSDDHKSHVQFRQRLRNGECPPGFNVSLPVLFAEIIYETNLFVNTSGDYIFANGDPTGFGYHGDFVAGWEEGVLEEVLNTHPNCTSPNATYPATGNQWDCKVFDLQSDEIATNCFFDRPAAIADEPVTGIMPTLPGNMQIYYGPAPESVLGQGNASSGIASATSATNYEASTLPVASPTTPYGNITVVVSPLPITSVPLTSSVVAAPQQPFTTITTTYTSDGTAVNLVIVEEVETVTVTEDANMPTGSPAKRHGHKHHAHAGH